ncbi:MAG: acyl-CoA carboxylase subunit epsilon [Catenulisporales bacterium]|nr:acyl-CoA carboxylase subunit epsilon [Catenulisporales bacterium]
MSAASPEIRVVQGNPTPDEVAAVVAVLAAVSATQLRSGNDQRSDKPPSGWTARERGVRAPLRAGPGGWRASAFPQAR